MVAENTPSSASGPGSAGTNAEDPVKVLLDEIGAFTTSTGHFVQARLDTVRIRARSLVARAIATLAATAIIVAAAITGTVYVVHGTALSLTAALGGRTGLAYLLTGLACVLCVCTASVLGIWCLRTRRRDEIVDKYERRKPIERSIHDRDMDQAVRGTA